MQLHSAVLLALQVLVASGAVQLVGLQAELPVLPADSNQHPLTASCCRTTDAASLCKVSCAKSVRAMHYVVCAVVR